MSLYCKDVTIKLPIMNAAVISLLCDVFIVFPGKGLTFHRNHFQMTHMKYQSLIRS